MHSSETKNGDDDIIDMKGAISNHSDVITKSNFEVIPSAVANENIQESVDILLGCEGGDNTTNQYSSSISLVPNFLRDRKPESFNPTLVSIGPLHHEDENLQRNEGLKRKYMHDLLDRLRSPPPEQMLAACLRKVNESMQKIRKCYVGMKSYSDHELARMMVMDGCFILEFLSPAKELNDLLWVQINKDLLLVENQIPLFVLEYIFECTILKCKSSASLTDHLKPLLKYAHRCLFIGEIPTPDVWAHVIDHDHDHILSLFHKCYQIELTLSSVASPLICNAVELEKAGVTFKPNEDATSWSLAIKIEWWYAFFAWFAWFWVKPTVKIPVMNIEDNTETILRNIIAYEQTTQVVNYFTSYAIAIDDLVDSGQDIAKLVESKVIINRLGSNEEAANMINSICLNVIASNFYNNEWKELENYYNGCWPRNIARLRRTYFNNPWNIIALTAGIILFVLTLIQTYFSVKPTK